MTDAVVVLLGGDRPDPRIGPVLPAGAVVIAADSGADQAPALGLRVDEVVGDLDSVSPEGLEAAVRAGAVVERHPADKDVTDAELALIAARRHHPDHIVVVGGYGGRADHMLGLPALLSRPDLVGEVRTEAWWGAAHLDVLHGEVRVRVHGPPGSLVSLLPLGTAAIGVTTEGLRWVLRDADLDLGTSRGTSNEMVGVEASVSLRIGALLVVQPDAVAELPRVQQ